MPPSSKRRTRQREADIHATSEADIPDSSPTRPSAKKRKVNGGRASPHMKPQSPPEPVHAEELDSSLVDAGANQDVVDSVVACLAVPKEPTTAMTEFSNTKPSLDNSTVQAYAKIAGRTWTYFVKTMRVNIGRPREDSEPSQRQDLQSSPVPDESSIPVDIDLGPSKYVSRHHASIYYDDGKWCIMVNGRNGIRVNTGHIKRGQSSQLSCGDVIEISNTQMMFITPEEEPTIDPSYLERAKKMAAGEEASSWNSLPHGHPESQGPHTRGSLRGSDPIQTYLPPGQVPLAPAPPYFKRQTTPKAERTQEVDRRVKQSPMYNRGMMMESTEEIDFSKDQARDLKPPYSYATMIAQAIFSSEEEKLTLNNIYQWIMEKYAFYRFSQTGWQNSIRHNLSLNKAFQKVPRRTDEPGKGMKWQIAPESRDEFLKKQAPRKIGHSSAPNSPASKDYSVFKSTSTNPGYDRSYEGQFPVNRASSQTSPSHSNPPNSQFNSFPAGPPEAYTPERGPRPRNSYDINHTDPPSDFNDGSPLPARPRSNTTHLTSAAQAREATSPPTLSSSFFNDDHNPPMITPAPRRQQPRLAPPSTAQLPSKFMPQSSPAPFWTMANLAAGTPRIGIGESSPLKRGREMDDLPSSSPPPREPLGGVREMGSPTKRERSNLGGSGSQDTLAQSQSQSQSQGQSQSQAPSQPHGLPSVSSIEHPVMTTTNGIMAAGGNATATKPEPEEEAVGGFDLAKGFQPISSFHANLRETTKAGSS